MHKEEPLSLASSIVDFCRFARTKGLSIGIQETIAALESVSTIDISDRQVFAYALRAVLCSTKEEWDLFDGLFDAFWSMSRPRGETARRDAAHSPKTNRDGRSANPGLSIGSSEAPSEAAEGKTIAGASAYEGLKNIDFSNVPQDDLATLEQISMRLLRQMSLRLSRRLKIRNLPERVDLRRTIRRSVAHGGDPFVLAYKAKRLRKHKLVLFLDVSGSMNPYSLFLVKFAYALQKHLDRVHTFVFSTNIVEITDALRTRDLSDAMRTLSRRAAGWSGGTRIGESLRELNRVAGRQIFSRETIFIILSDGWDTGTPEMLAAELRATRRRVRKLIWLNPLLGLADYQPVTRGMQAALPHVDVFAPAHDLESLLALEGHL